MDLTIGLNLKHFATDKFFHTVSLSKSARATSIGNANATEEIIAQVTMLTTLLNEKVSFNGSLGWFNGDDQAEDGNGEDYDIYSFVIGSGYQITAKQSVNIKLLI